MRPVTTLDTPAWEIGLAQGDITAWEPGMAMDGWGRFDQRVRGVAERLQVRALVVHDRAGDGRIALAVLDLLAIPLLLRQAVVERLATARPERAWRPHDVMLLATHTHSAPAGLTDSPFYNSVNFGFAPDVFDHVVRVTVDTILRAEAALRPGRIRPGRARIPVSDPVAFNRSLAAHQANADVETAGSREDAVDREMTVLRLEDERGDEVGAVSFFASHGTTVHGDQPLLHPDHKGLAAERLSRMRGGASPGGAPYVALFAQTCAGDATPNHRPSRKRGFDVAAWDDDEESARGIAELEAAHAARALDEARNAPELRGPLAGFVRHVPIGDIDLAEEFCQGCDGARTREARIGLPFMLGTREGAGPFAPLRKPLLAWMAARRRRALRRIAGGTPETAARVDPLISALDLGRGIEGRFLSLLPCTLARWVGPLDPGSAWMGAGQRAGVLVDRPWVNPVVPGQLVRLGSLLLAGVPGEPTTQAGRRLRAALLDTAAALDVSDVLVLGYANAYTSYVTTREEYLCQQYEGGSTLFGPWTHGAWCTVLHAMAHEPWPSSSRVPGPAPVLADRELLLREREEGRKRLGRFRRLVEGQRLGDVRT